MDPAEPTPDPTSNRWGNRTPSPDFVKRAVSPLSPAQVAQPPTTAVMSDLNVPGHIPPETLPYVPAWSSARQCASSTAVLPPPSHRDDGYRLLPALSTLPPETQPVPSGGLDILALLCDTQPKLPVPSSTDVQPVLVPTEGQGSLHQESTNREADEPNHPVTAQSVGDEMAPSYANTAFTHQYVRPGSSGPVDMPAADEAIHQDQPLNPPFSSPISLWSLHNQSRKRSGTQIVIEDVDSLLPKRQRMSSQDSLSHHSPENAQAHGVSDLSIAPTTSSPPPFLNNVTQFTDKAVIISRRKTQSDIRVPVFPTSSRQRRHTSSSASMTNGKPPVPLSWDMKSPTFMPMPVSESAIEDTNPGSFTEAGPRRLSLDGTAAGAGIKQLRPSPLLEATILGTEQSFNDDASKNPVTNAKKRPAPRNGGTSKRKRTKPTSVAGTTDTSQTDGDGGLVILDPNRTASINSQTPPTDGRDDRSVLDSKDSGPQDPCGTCKVVYQQEVDSGVSNGPWIGCDHCSVWHHAKCVGLTTAEVDKIDKFHCPSCVPTRGPSILKRTSGRAHTAIDYNALHNGSSVPIKNPEDSKIHPYINIIRNGTKPFTKPQFKQVSPGDVTVDALDNMVGGWTEPLIVPAAANPAPWREPPTPQSMDEKSLATPPRSYTPPSVPPASLLDRKCRPRTPDEVAVDDSQRDKADGLGMVIPIGLTVRKVGELVGMDQPVEVIDVITQASSKDEKWTMTQLVNYFENSNREKIYNCISCEVSSTPLGKMISRPQFVRQTDLVDRVWRPTPGKERPTVGKYVLMSVADSFTDFHVDFAGSSVFYHIYEGEKVFLTMRPTEKALKAYENWCRSSTMNATWFPDLVDEPCMIVKLHKGDTMFIPSGWIHAVYTPVDSMVIGGNFLTRNHYETQSKIQAIEVATDVKLSQRYPKYTTLMYHVVYDYLSKDSIPEKFDDRLAHQTQLGARVKGYSFRDLSNASTKIKSTRKFTKSELEGLPHLLTFIQRTAGIAGGWITKANKPGEPKLTQKTIEAVKKAIPEPFRADPLACAQLFGRWVNYIRRIYNLTPIPETLPMWTSTDWTPPQYADRKQDALLKKRQKEAEECAKEEARREELNRNRPGLRIRKRPSETPAPEPKTADLFRERRGSSAPKRGRSGSVAPIAQRKRKISTDAPLPAAKKGKVPAESKGKKAKNQRPLDNPVLANLQGIVGDSEDGARFKLSDGSYYLYKSSNLGPARTGCENCRKKKTKCKHTEEIGRALKRVGILGLGEKVTGKQKIEDETPEGIPKGIEEHVPDVDMEADIICEVSNESKGDGVHQEEEDQDGEKPDMSLEPSTIFLPSSEIVTMEQATSNEITDTQPAGDLSLKPGRKPSCPMCKVLKKKCPHDVPSTPRSKKQSAIYHSNGAVNNNNTNGYKYSIHNRADDHNGEGDMLDIIRLAGSTPRKGPGKISGQKSSADRDADVAAVSLHWDTSSILDDAGASAYESRRATSTPEDPTIMAPPMDPTPARARSGPHVTVAEPSTPARAKPPRSPSFTSTTPKTVSLVQSGTNRRKSKGPTRTYTSGTKTIKRKAGDQDKSASETHRKSLKTSYEGSPNSKTTGDLSTSAVDLRRIALGLRGSGKSIY